MVKTSMYLGRSPRAGETRTLRANNRTTVVFPKLDGDQAIKRSVAACNALARRVKGGFDLDGDGSADITAKQWTELQSRMAG